MLLQFVCPLSLKILRSMLYFPSIQIMRRPSSCEPCRVRGVCTFSGLRGGCSVLCCTNSEGREHNNRLREYGAAHSWLAAIYFANETAGCWPYLSSPATRLMNIHAHAIYTYRVATSIALFCA